ncbi:hypothetical protein K438DRAFT_1866824 [Mycena galopus ATCC 62051]|nr:hypothetical protein K438DRAFT_1866824 [Mycena galopus ATCC 62051]
MRAIAFTLRILGTTPPRFFRHARQCYAIHTEATPSPRHRLPTRILHSISTLNACLLTTADHLDISGRIYVTVRFPKSRAGLKASFFYERRRIDGSYPRIPFPSESTGFLYYYRDPHAAPLEGSVRFRITSDNLPSSFVHGQDLLLPSGAPWQIMLLQVAMRAEYSRIRDQLLEEDLVTPEQLAQCRQIFSHRPTFSETTLFRLNQSFPVNFGGEITLTVVGEELHVMRSQCFRARTFRGNIYSPWAGSALARFEPSTSSEHAGRRIVHLRITKIITPVSCTMDEKEYQGRVLRPEEGQLLTVSFRGGPPKPWSYDIDDQNNHSAAALRVLWDSAPPIRVL